MSVSPSAGIIWRAVTEMFTRSMYVTILTLCPLTSSLLDLVFAILLR